MNKYVVKCIGKIYKQNYVTVKIDSHKNVIFLPKLNVSIIPRRPHPKITRKRIKETIVAILIHRVEISV